MQLTVQYYIIMHACMQYYIIIMHGIIMHGIIKIKMHAIIKINMRIILYYKDKYLSYIYYIVHAELSDYHIHDHFRARTPHKNNCSIKNEHQITCKVYISCNIIILN